MIIGRRQNTQLSPTQRITPWTLRLFSLITAIIFTKQKEELEKYSSQSSSLRHSLSTRRLCWPTSSSVSASCSSPPTSIFTAWRGRPWPTSPASVWGWTRAARPGSSTAWQECWPTPAWLSTSSPPPAPTSPVNQTGRRSQAFYVILFPGLFGCLSSVFLLPSSAVTSLNLASFLSPSDLSIASSVLVALSVLNCRGILYKVDLSQISTPEIHWRLFGKQMTVGTDTILWMR